MGQRGGHEPGDAKLVLDGERLSAVRRGLSLERSEAISLAQVKEGFLGCGFEATWP